MDAQTRYQKFPCAEQKQWAVDHGDKPCMASSWMSGRGPISEVYAGPGGGTAGCLGSGAGPAGNGFGVPGDKAGRMQSL